ncbi:predicted protein [Nematostella vectensis]|uniref:Uncharacterized protein n=1 Tax=Nematostella vectensis TaxID=45351 RepID=A7T624_NEMVE|nr:predicted protein [Nematostella vectensis]|eukprot:XP_001620683.1 hypothetical protein NEMVEDRAFT_v1g222828 [Nematostella vectensis]
MAELTGLTSPRMDWNATDLQQALKKFRATVELYFSGPLKSKSEEEKSSPHEFHVVNTTGPTILGLPTCTAMKLVTLNHSLSKDQAEPAKIRPAQVPKDDPEAKAALLRQYADCFEGIGCFSGEFHITLDPTVPAVVHPPRRVPEALQEPLRKELESLVQQGIITKDTHIVPGLIGTPLKTSKYDQTQ